jgi:hypothetical protein
MANCGSGAGLEAAAVTITRHAMFDLPAVGNDHTEGAVEYNHVEEEAVLACSENSGIGKPCNRTISDRTIICPRLDKNGRVIA